ncbi:TenA family protein [Curtobacterium sp. MCBD17_040]|uniref:TenA family protein n=1 Tax=Curtobacterium sp. MCBD17_040 TaxID=2175674 RepID=UPI000DA9F4DB|nr:TenA family protein [Curtobacterium sp. MCBD17_040]WIB64719.1 TenA family protein [Curtobacterium sp. MCBD17_040]
MSFTDEVWETVAPIRDAVDALPFLVALERGSLPRATFLHYLEQDAAYLGAYARVLAAAATRADDAADLAFWSNAAANAVAVERQLHASHGVDGSSVAPSPTCVAYTSYLLSLTASSSYPVIVAGVLPCFWLYDDVGRRLRHRVGDLDGHPYGDWIGTYGDPGFTAVTAEARDVVDRAADAASAHQVEQMRQAFTTASRYEWMFWDAAWRHEVWPV